MSCVKLSDQKIRTKDDPSHTVVSINSGLMTVVPVLHESFLNCDCWKLIKTEQMIHYSPLIL